MERLGAEAWALCSLGDTATSSFPRGPICLSPHEVSFPGLLALPEDPHRPPNSRQKLLPLRREGTHSGSHRHTPRLEITALQPPGQRTWSQKPQTQATGRCRHTGQSPVSEARGHSPAVKPHAQALFQKHHKSLPSVHLGWDSPKR